jgi:hypothetical protein
LHHPVSPALRSKSPERTPIAQDMWKADPLAGGLCYGISAAALGRHRLDCD